MFNSALPHILLFPLLFLSLYLPPFKGRTPIFTTLIIATIAACALDEFPEFRQARYAMNTSWIWYFPVLEKLLLRRPSVEHECWRLDRKPHEAESIVPFSREKARWAASLLLSTRGVGWNHGSRRTPAARNPGEPSGRFVCRSLLMVLAGSLTVEAVVLIAERWAVPRQWTLEGLPMILLSELLMAATVWGSWTFQYNFVAAVSVGLGLNKPKDWPPIFGSLSSASTVAGFWGTYWHGILRQPALGFSHYVIQQCGIPKGTFLAYAIHLTTGFLFSTIFHLLSLYPISKGYISLSKLCVYTTTYFMSQVAAILFESAVMSWYRSRRSLGPEKGKEKERVGPQQATPSLFGYLWTLAWLGLSGWLFVKVYFDVGAMEWKVPVGFIQMAMDLLAGSHEGRHG